MRIRRQACLLFGATLLASSSAFAQTQTAPAPVDVTPSPQPVPQPYAPMPSVPPGTGAAAGSADATAKPDAKPDEAAAAPADGEAKGSSQVSGFIPGQGFVLRSPDETFKLRVGLQSAIRAQVSINGKAQLSNPFLTLRPIFEGNLYKKWIRYWTSLELAANPVYLLDSYVEIQPIEAFGLRIGQQWTPFSRHEYLYGPHQLLLPDWDPVANYFWTGRDKGITAFGTLADKKFEYQLGAYMGSPLRQFTPIRGNYLFVARVGLNPAGAPTGTEFAYADKPDEDATFKYAIGVNGFTSKADSSSENFNPATFQFETVPGTGTTIKNGIGADFFLQSRRFVTLVEGYLTRTDLREGRPKYTSVGGFAQAGVLIYDRVVDAVARFSWADVNLDEDHDQAYGIEVGGNYYIHSPNVAFKLRYGYGNQLTPPGDPTTAGGAPLILSAGHVHVMTAQINTSF